MRVSCLSELFERCSKVLVIFHYAGCANPLCYRLKRDRMARWLHTLALLVIAAVLANAQCFTSCFMPGSSSAVGQHSTCCSEHHSPKSQPQSGCQHKRYELSAVEWDGAGFYKASSLFPCSGDFVALGSLHDASGAQPISLSSMPPGGYIVPRGPSPLLLLSVLRI